MAAAHSRSSSSRPATVPRILTKNCHQKSNAFECTYQWTIENFSFYGRSKISSLQFAPSDANLEQDYGFKWSLCLYPRQKPDLDNEDEYMSLYLWMNRTYGYENANLEAKVTFLFAIIDRDGELVQKIDYDYTLVSYSVESAGWGFPKFAPWNVLQEDLDRYIPNDAVTVYCKIRTLTNIDCVVRPIKSSPLDDDDSGTSKSELKFVVEPLKNLCEKKLFWRITANEVADLLMSAHLSNAPTLKTKCIEFIRKNPNRVLATSGWQKMLTTMPNLVEDIFDRDF